MSTYFRPNGFSKFYLKRSINSISHQTFKDWKLYLIGDFYENNSQFEQISMLLPKDKIKSINLDKSVEREKYTGKELWKMAGFTANNIGLELARKECKIHARLDDDDYWIDNHLEILSKGYPNNAFVYTRSKNRKEFLPKEETKENLPPKAYNLIHSAASWDLEKINFNYLDASKTDFVAGDAFMWESIKAFCDEKNYKTLYIPEITVVHDFEGERTISVV